MQAILRHSDSVACFLFPEGQVVRLTEQGLEAPVRSRGVTSQTHAVVSVSAPALFVSEALAWVDDAWVVRDQAALDAERAAMTARLQAARLQAVETERARRIGAGVPYVFPDGHTGTVQLRDARDQGNVQAVASAGNALVTLGDTTTQVAFRDQENVTHQLTGAEAVAFGLFVMNAIAALYTAAWAHKDAIKALAEAGDLEGLETYDIASGWPSG